MTWLLTNEERRAADDRPFAQAKKILDRLEKANCEAVPGKRLTAFEQALEKLRAELDAAQGKGKGTA